MKGGLPTGRPCILYETDARDELVNTGQMPDELLSFEEWRERIEHQKRSNQHGNKKLKNDIRAQQQRDRRTPQYKITWQWSETKYQRCYYWHEYRWRYEEYWHEYECWYDYDPSTSKDIEAIFVENKEAVEVLQIEVAGIEAEFDLAKMQQSTNLQGWPRVRRRIRRICILAP